MLTSINSTGLVNPIKAFQATNAFKAAQAPVKPEVETEELSGVNLQDNNVNINSKNIEEIKEYAKIVGEDLTAEDIKYGLTYGRSIIANYIA